MQSEHQELFNDSGREVAPAAPAVSLPQGAPPADSCESAAPFFDVWTDGSITKNPGGAGGWCAIIRTNGDHVARDEDGTMALHVGCFERVLTGAEHNSTNNRAELMAVIVALEALPLGARIHVTSDSEYVVRGVNTWSLRWKANGWVSNTKATLPKNRTIANLELWQRLDAARQGKQVTCSWVRGHVGHPLNERCDALAGRAAQALLQQAKQPAMASVGLANSASAPARVEQTHKVPTLMKHGRVDTRLPSTDLPA